MKKTTQKEIDSCIDKYIDDNIKLHSTVAELVSVINDNYAAMIKKSKSLTDGSDKELLEMQDHMNQYMKDNGAAFKKSTANFEASMLAYLCQWGTMKKELQLTLAMMGITL